MSPNPSNTQSQMAETKNRGGRGQGTTTGNLQMTDSNINEQQVTELLCQALETEIGGVKIYETAIECARNEDLKEEWGKYLEETRNHERILRECFEKMDLDTNMETPGRGIVRSNGEALVKAMQTAQDSGDPNLAQIVAAECVVLAETKDHSNWQLIGEVASKFEGEARTALEEAYEEVEEQEDEHLYHTRGWARELWLESFGLPASLPPPEEKQNVTSMMGAARVMKSRGRGGRKSTQSKKTKTNTNKKAKTTNRTGRGRKAKARSR